MGASGIFTIGARYPKKHATDTMNTPKHIPLREFDDFDTFRKSMPRDTTLIAIELNETSENLTTFKHPERAIYLLGAGDTGITIEIQRLCDRTLKVPFEKNSLNVAVCGSIVIYDRYLKMK